VKKKKICFLLILSISKDFQFYTLPLEGHNKKALLAWRVPFIQEIIPHSLIKG